MKYNFSAKFLGGFYHHVTKKFLKEKNVSKETLKDIKNEYKETILRTKDIGKAQLLSSYLMGAYFIALCRKSGLTPDENYDCLVNGLLGSKLFHKFMGTADTYFDPKRTAQRKEWSKESHLKKYENDWVVDILDKTDDYELGYNYHECGICKLFKDENCFEWAKYMCKMDWVMADMMGLDLKRTKTLAEGGDFCDFRYSRKK